MPSAIETELRARCAVNENVRLLLAQWEYDRVLIGQALTTVAAAFPHYSRHDATHSETILERIATMLGKKGLGCCDPTDLWLLLEAAYLHDCGMVVLESTRREDLSSTEFSEHLRSTIQGADHELAEHAKRVCNPAVGNPLGILEAHLDLLLVYAEFVRKRHPTRAEDAVHSPYEKARIESPRTTLLPNRLWHLIGRICRAHGESRDFVRGQLPMRESGIAGDTCHPRFVASMLRLGDLLDLDSGRFCPTVNATIPRLPRSSEAHRAKHEGICHLLVCPSRIEVEGAYTDMDAYLEAERWFGWLREELSDQLIHWDEIAPSHLGPLPSAGSISARLHDQIVLDPSARPRFEVDREQMLNLFQGANIYNGPDDAAREILQNAIDATIFRIAYEAISAKDSKPKDLDDLRARLAKYPIEVKLAKSDRSAKGPNMVAWTMTVRDQGIGIRLQDATAMLRLGASRRNSYRQALKAWLPEWARPSGTFGIGLHSLLPYCREVEIVSRHPEDPDGITLVLEPSPEAADATVILRKRPRSGNGISFPAAVGTSVEIHFEFDKLARDRPKRRFDPHRHDRASHTLDNYDFVLDDEIAHAPTAICEMLREMKKGSLCGLELELPMQPRQHESDDSESGKCEIGRYFDQKEGVELRILKCGLDRRSLRAKYRGADVSMMGLSTPFFDGDCDLHVGDASDFLTLSRNDFTPSGYKLAEKHLANAVHAIIARQLDPSRCGGAVVPQELRPYFSLYGLLYKQDCHGEEWRGLHSHGEEWRELQFMAQYWVEVGRQSPTVTLGAIADAKTALIGGNGEQFGYAATVDNGTVTIKGGFPDSRDHWLARFMKMFFPARTLEAICNRHRRYRLTQDTAKEKEDVTDDALLVLLRPPDQGFSGRRQLLPCPLRFANLAWVDDDSIWRPGRDALISTSMVNPFVYEAYRPARLANVNYRVTLPDPQGYVRWLSKQRKSEPESVVAVALLSFVQHADELMMEEWEEIKRYDLDDVSRSLQRLISAG